MPSDGLDDDDLGELLRAAKPTMIARCEVVRRAATTGDPSTFEAALVDAHRLAGGVGMFGLHAASDLAIHLDDLIRAGALDDRRDEVSSVVDALTQALEAAG